MDSKVYNDLATSDFSKMKLNLNPNLFLELTVTLLI